MVTPNWKDVIPAFVHAVLVAAGGAEYNFNNLVTLRAGYSSLFIPDSEEGLTVGLGLSYGGVTVDISHMTMRHLGSVQQFGAAIVF